MGRKTYEVGDVLRDGAAEPVDGTPLLGEDGRVELYEQAALRGSPWAKYLAWGGPFVVAPDYEQLVNGQ